MAEPIERFWRAFGAGQKAYFRIIDCNSRMLKMGIAAGGPGEDEYHSRP